jgi:hypothetical protein
MQQRNIALSGGSRTAPNDHQGGRGVHQKLGHWNSTRPAFEKDRHCGVTAFDPDDSVARSHPPQIWSINRLIWLTSALQLRLHHRNPQSARNVSRVFD